MKTKTSNKSGSYFLTGGRHATPVDRTQKKGFANFFRQLLATFYILLPVNHVGGRSDISPFPPKIPHKE